jgi:preprotein translocase subunit SecG
MLSFMREQEGGNPSDRSSAGTGPRDARSPDPGGSQEYLTVSANSKNLRRSTILVIVLFCMGLVGLWLMIRRSQPQAASAQQSREDEIKIETAISELTGVSSEMTDRMDEIVEKFYEFSDVVQVKVNELVKNPFQVEGCMEELKDQIVVADDSQTQAELIRRQRLQQKARNLRLLSVMRSENGRCCMINDQILREGDRIEDFTVTQIGSNFVEIVWPNEHEDDADESVSETQDLKIVLKLSE